MLALIIGLSLGFFGSMPIAGPTAVILVSKGLENRRRAGIYIAAGAAAAESVYVFMAFWGLTSVLGRFPMLLPATRLVGSTLLIGIGAHFVLRKEKAREPSIRGPEQAGLRNIAFGASLTALNPSLLVTWTAAVSVAHATGLLTVRTSGAVPFALGSAIGIVGWFAILLWLLSHFGDRIQPRSIDRLIRWMGGLLMGVGVLLLVRGIESWGAPPR
jgi:threonine/homoserine/homoserine lactone efflux protein